MRGVSKTVSNMAIDGVESGGGYLFKMNVVKKVIGS